MAGRHWLDPLARRLLVATGQLPPPPPLPQVPPPVAPVPPLHRPPDGLLQEHDEGVERELLALKLAHNPRLRFRTVSELGHAAALGWSLSVHRAAAADWLRLPDCRPDLIDRLIRRRRDGCRWEGPQDLALALPITPQQLQGWLPVLRFDIDDAPGPEAPAPLAINQAPERLLRERLALGPERCRLLLRERARAPFRDLADLERRLRLPPELVEAWIGRFRYAAAPGPVLPPARPLRR